MVDSEAQRAGRGNRVLLFAVLLAGVACAVVWLRPQSANGPESKRPRVELAYLNLGPDATYVGSDACKACHGDEHTAHGRTRHGRSLRTIESAQDAPPGAFAHEPSGLSYRVAAVDGGVRVREVLPRPAGGEELLGDHALTYALGSGAHVQCYLAEVDGFLVQAPVARKDGAWTMAPTYDRPLHPSFARPVGRACLYCHAGRATNLDGSLHRIRFEEKAIGCERCHGPGSLHVAHQEKLALERAPDAKDASEADLTIVNPARLTRAGSLDVCAQCHADDGLTVDRRGRDRRDWRPGLPLSDYRVTYRPKTPVGEVPVVGPEEQLRASRCFQASPDMDCTTCHDAHGGPSPAERVAHYNAKCATCHGADGCRLDAAMRRQSEGGDDCTTCHMPSAETRVPHGTFTHHRIGMHGPGAGDETFEIGEQLELVVLEDLPRRTETEAGRDLALALLRLPSWKPAGMGSKMALSRRIIEGVMKQARQGLTQAVAEGDAEDPEATVAYAMLIARSQTKRAARLLQEALDGKRPLREETRVYALMLLGRALYEMGRTDEAVAVMERLTGLRRSVEDWEFLADITEPSKDPESLARAVAQVLAIAPHLESSHFLAAGVFSQLGSKGPANHHQAIALQLARHLTDQRNKAERSDVERTKEKK